ncbi:unnamed protein product, partial [Strongylus vulgaris]
MQTTTIYLLFVTLLTYAKDASNAPTIPPPDFIYPVQHVRETQNGYLTYKDRQLGSEEDDKQKNCVPRDSPEGKELLHLINKQLAEAAEGNSAAGVPETPAPTQILDSSALDG